MLELLRSEVFLRNWWHVPTYDTELYYNRGCNLTTDGNGQVNVYGFVNALDDKLVFKLTRRQKYGRGPRAPYVKLDYRTVFNIALWLVGLGAIGDPGDVQQVFLLEQHKASGGQLI